MAHILIFVLYIIRSVLELESIAIIVWAVMSWLVQFNVMNYRHPVVRQIDAFLEAVTRPVLRPFRRFIPNLGGIDITPIIALIVIQGLIDILIDPAMGYLRGLPFF